MTKSRLDLALTRRGLTATRSQAESLVRLGRVKVDGRVVRKAGYFVGDTAEITLADEEQFVSRAALKLKSVAEDLGLDFAGKTVLDVGSSTGGFTEFALSRGAKKVFAVDVGSEQLHPKLRGNPWIELLEKTDIRNVIIGRPPNQPEGALEAARPSLPPRTESPVVLGLEPDIVLADVSFISLREILPHVARNLAGKKTEIVAMLKPQFETGQKVKNAGVIKNDTERRRILHGFEIWARKYFVIKSKRDSAVAGAHGNCERFYLLIRKQST